MIYIRRCEICDIEKVMMFIDKQWSKDHILSTHRSLIDWQHRTRNGYNYLLAWDDSKLVGVLGYIPTRRFDEELYDNNILWLALWKVLDNYKSAILGLKLLKALEATETNNGLAVNGIDKTHSPMYKALGYKVVDLVQYYMVNKSLSQKIIKKPEDFSLAVPSYGTASFIKMCSGDLTSIDLSSNLVTANKTPLYFINRFLEHPFYEYTVYGISQNSSISALIATRLVKQKDSIILRVVDFCGEPSLLGECGTAFSNLMLDCNAEYVDFWQTGISPKILKKAGFEAVDPNGNLICPNFFEPFKPENGRIISCYKYNNHNPFVICRADGDQDRPNQLNI